MVLGRRSHHGWATNINILDRCGQVTVGVGHSSGKGIQVYYYHIYGLNSVLGHYAVIFAATAEDSAMHFRVQGFDPAIHHLWKAGVVRHLSDCDRIITQQAKGAPSREYFYTLLGESLGKFNNAGFIGNTDQCAGNFS